MRKKAEIMDLTGNRAPRAPFARALIGGFAVLVCLLVAASSSGEVIEIVVDDLIHPISAEFIERGIAEAERVEAEAILVILRTPGGLETSTRDIVNAITRSAVPVIVWVEPAGSRAASAGFFILVSADVAAMAPGTNTGAAHPVLLGEQFDDVMKEKMQNDSAAFMRTVVDKRGRNVEAAEAAVRESKSYTEDEALELRLIDVIAATRADLFDQLDGRSISRFDGSSTTLDLDDQQVRTLEMTVRQRLLSFIMDPNVAYILFSIGMLGLWAELNNPGAILPGVVGGLFIILAVFALNIFPIRYAAVALILLAFALFALEAFVASHGVLATGGVVALFIGGLMLVDGPVPEMQVHWVTALAVSLPIGLISVFLVTIAIRAQRRRTETGEEGMIGERGTAQTRLDPTGKVFVHGEIWTATSTTPIEPGSTVVVTRIDGLHLTVAPADSSSENAPPPDRPAIPSI